MKYRILVDEMIKESCLMSYFDKDRKEKVIQRLFAMERLLKGVGGSIRSRQIVALALVQEIDIDKYLENIFIGY